MKVLFVYSFCGLGGVETSILNKLDALRLFGVEGHVLFGQFYGTGSSSLADDERVSIGFQPDRVRVLLRREFDVIVVADSPAFVDLLEQMNVRATVLFETHASVPALLERFYTRLEHPLVARVVVPSYFNRRMVKAKVGHAKRVVVISNAINVDRFSLRSADVTCPVPMVPPGCPILLWVGRLEDEKNPAGFLETGVALLKSGQHVQLLVVGDAFNRAEYEAYRDKLLEGVPAEWRDRVTFCPSVPNDAMPDLYSTVAHSGGTLVSSSLSESSPMIFIEAMACECPVVSADVGGIGELISDGVTGALYASGDVEGAARKIAALIDDGQSMMRRAIVEAARAHVVKRHSLAAVGRQYRALLDEVADVARKQGGAEVPATSVAEPEESAGGRVIPGLVTTIIPVYNRAGLLKEAVESVLAQTYPDIEIIIVDDGSTDETAGVCDALAGLYRAVRVLHRPHVGRAGLTREAGRLAARGEYIQYLDSDDLLMPTKFSVMVQALQARPDSDVAYCYTRRYRLGESPTDVPAERTGETHEVMLPVFSGQRHWCTSTPIYRRRLCDRRGPWSDLLFMEDIEYEAGLATLQPRLLHCKEWLTDMRDHDLERLSRHGVLDSPPLLPELVRAEAMIYENLKRAALTCEDGSFRAVVDEIKVLHKKCNEHQLEQEADLCARLVMDATGCTDRALVGQYSLSAAIDPDVAVLRLQPGQAIRIPVRVTNHSTICLQGGIVQTELCYDVLRADGTPHEGNSPKSALGRPLLPGQSSAVEMWVRAPEIVGLYYVALDARWNNQVWLAVTGNRRGFIKLLVTERAGESLRQESEGPSWRLKVETDNEAVMESDAASNDGAAVRVVRSTGRNP